ncbi:hypothetical protein JCM17961_14140 [Endothiovibrio diazotrophicus]
MVLGGCNGCGKCCMHLTLVDRGRPIKQMEQFERLVAREPEYRFFRPMDARDEDGFIYFSCLLLGEDGRCTEYASRPSICREYPDPSMFRFGAQLPGGCGYYRAPERSFSDVLAEVQKEGNQAERPWWRRFTPQRLFARS